MLFTSSLASKVRNLSYDEKNTPSISATPLMWPAPDPIQNSKGYTAQRPYTPYKWHNSQTSSSQEFQVFGKIYPLLRLRSLRGPLYSAAVTGKLETMKIVLQQFSVNFGFPTGGSDDFEAEVEEHRLERRCIGIFIIRTINRLTCVPKDWKIERYEVAAILFKLM
ncbi:hypothetical protein K504DRAFT_497376 [Pleomassaria siparia CBS 279.74]|uniref:Uncharacterized protein n=1 Tax=Pleomassaria siparia CBS 279.74 TaxID=1314801 RepID=A0A6G1KSN9_9PLEO|nr:hypothetical protein K504DRAFT_497376 [Pleomassaria siparia CBS 279.74]